MPKRILQGAVVSIKADKTVAVRVQRTFMHPLYKKTVRKSAKYLAHDELNQCQEGQTVKIEECRPLSKHKSWVVITE